MAFRDVVIASLPLVYYEMQETAGTNADDSTPNNRDGTYVGSPPLGNTADPPFPGQKYVTLNGFDEEITMPAGVALPLNSAVTVMIFQKILTADVSDRVSFSVGLIDAPDRCAAHMPYNDNNIYWDYGSSATNGRISTSYAAYLDEWHLFHLVSAGNGGAFKAIYVDGAEANSAGISDGPDQAISGGTVGGFVVGMGNYNKGSMAHFAVWDRVLDPTEMEDQYDAALGGASIFYLKA